MFLVFALLLLALGVGLFMSVYSALFPFLESIGHISDYNVAYYSALSAVERGSLAIKYRSPGFEGSGGILVGTGRGPLSDQGVFLVSSSGQGNWRNISSRTNIIPSSGEGNGDTLLQDVDSKDYNALRYHTLENFLMSIDTTNTGSEYYSGAFSNLSDYSGVQMTGIFRLPSIVYSGFGGDPSANLCALQPGCDFDGDGATDDVIMNWKLGGRYLSTPFVILPHVDVFYYSGMVVNYPYDNSLRSSLFGTSVAINFTEYSPLYDFPRGDHLSGHVVVSSAATGIQTIPFQTILAGGSFTNLQLSLGLVTLLRSIGGSVYPYLEYQFSFAQPIADRFYKITGHGRNRDYDIQIQVKKPTVKGSVGGDFTVIF